MVGIADENGRTYESKFGTYNKESGFVFVPPYLYGFDKNLIDTNVVNALFHEDLWKLKEEPVKKMSLADIEKELGYRVQIVDPNPDEEEVTKKDKKAIDETIDVFRRIFGIDIDPEEYY